MEAAIVPRMHTPIPCHQIPGSECDLKRSLGEPLGDCGVCHGAHLLSPEGLAFAILRARMSLTDTPEAQYENQIDYENLCREADAGRRVSWMDGAFGRVLLC